MVRRFGICLVIFGLLSGGCVELGILLGDGWPNGSTNGSATDGSDGDDQPPDSNGPDGVPVVRLDVSNSNPLAGEELLFECTLVGGDPDGVTFAFQPAGGRLIVDPQSGTALYVVDQSDVGVELVVTCTATNAFGTSEPSNQQVIIPMQ